jgi:hypothetical protein
MYCALINIVVMALQTKQLKMPEKYSAKLGSVTNTGL